MLQIIGLIIVAGIMLVFFMPLFLVLFGVSLLIVFIGWAFGVPIEVKKKDVVIGHVVRTKFIPLRK